MSNITAGLLMMERGFPLCYIHEFENGNLRVILIEPQAEIFIALPWVQLVRLRIIRDNLREVIFTIKEEHNVPVN